jgi:hypothetical protein
VIIYEKVKMVAHVLSRLLTEVLAAVTQSFSSLFVSLHRIPTPLPKTCKRGGRLQVHVTTIRSFVIEGQ